MTAPGDRLRAPSRRVRDDAGVSLVELMVSASIGLLVLSCVVAVFAGTMRTAHTIAVQNPSAAGVRVMSEEMSRELRVAVRPWKALPALAGATATGVSFYSLLNRTGAAATGDLPPTLVTYSHAGNCLTVTKTPGVATGNTSPPFYTWPAAGAVSRCVFRTTTAPAFSYFTESTIALNDSNAMTVGAGLDATARDSVRSVQVVLTGTNPDDPHVASATVKTRVTLVNLVNN